MKPKYIASIPVETGPNTISRMCLYSGNTPPDDEAVAHAAEQVRANNRVFPGSEISDDFTTIPELHVQKRRRLFAGYVTEQIIQLSNQMSEDSSPSDVKEN